MNIITRARFFPIVVFFSITVALYGCNALSTRIHNVTSLASKNGFSNTIIHGGKFTINSFYRLSNKTKFATVFIEGDGKAWASKKRISPNPTPNNPIGFKLALNDSSDNVIYLARPCQYVNLSQETQCMPEYWTSKRASKEIVQSLSHAINVLKKRFNISSLRLVGYSGGATIATILAANRDDVIDLRSVAGNLDIDAFSNHHNVSPLIGSINPIEYAEQLVNIPQHHYWSSNDSVITTEVISSYTNRLKKHDATLRCVKIIDTDIKSHTSGWDRYWATSSHDIATCRE